MTPPDELKKAEELLSNSCLHSDDGPCDECLKDEIAAALRRHAVETLDKVLETLPDYVGETGKPIQFCECKTRVQNLKSDLETKGENGK